MGKETNNLTPAELSELDINVLPVKCPLCNEEMTRLTREHALSHGYKSLTQYRKDNGINYLTLAQRSRENFKRLFNIDFKRWVVGYWHNSHEMRYVTKQYDPFAPEYRPSHSKFPMSDAMFNNHFSGKNPLAIFAYGTHARYFFFDIDSKEKAEGDAFRLIKQMRRLGIPREHIHVSFSGSKGYHVGIFINKNIKFADWKIFSDYIRYHTGLIGEEKKVEHRPSETNGHALKMPLTFHYKTRKFAAFCDVDTLEEYDVIESHDYLNNIEQMDAGIIFDILREARKSIAERQAEVDEEERKRKEEQRKKQDEDSRAVKVENAELFQTSEEKEETAKRILIHGLNEKGTRWLAMRDTLIPYLKIIQGTDEEETAEILRDWTKQEIARGKVDSSYDDCVKEIDTLIKSWYSKVNDFYAVIKEIEITRMEIDWVMSVIEKGGTRNARDLLWVLLLLSKAYKERVDRVGTFYASRAKVQQLLSNPKRISPATIQKQRQWLVEHEYIKFEVPRNSYKNRLATVYELSDIDEVTPVIIDSVQLTDNTDGRQLLSSIAEKLYSPKALKRLKVN